MTFSCSNISNRSMKIDKLQLHIPHNFLGYFGVFFITDHVRSTSEGNAFAFSIRLSADGKRRRREGP